MSLTTLELCAGGGGQAIGLEAAGFEPIALVEIDEHCCATLRGNRPQWNVIHADLRTFDAKRFAGVDLVAGGVPCPPFSKAGKQLGKDDERDMFPEALRVVSEAKPRAVMLENVRGLLDPRFDSYRQNIESKLSELGYRCYWKLLNASDFGVPQLRPRVVMVALERGPSDSFEWPHPTVNNTTVGASLLPLMQSNGWRDAKSWAESANRIAPTIVGGSKKHGGPDLGPTRAKRAWAELGVNGKGIADSPPGPDHSEMPKLTVPMVAKLQGFPDDWKIFGRKTAAYRQIGNAFPPPVAQAVANCIRNSLQNVALSAAA